MKRLLYALPLASASDDPMTFVDALYEKLISALAVLVFLVVAYAVYDKFLQGARQTLFGRRRTRVCVHVRPPYPPEEEG